LATFVKGDVIVVPFPFSDLTRAKRRPALVIAKLDGDDIILCQVTSKNVKDRYSVSLTDNDFESGHLKRESNVRPNRIFTADIHIILYKIGHLKPEKTYKIVEIITGILHS